MTITPSIYVVDDDPSVRSSLRLLLTSVGFNVRTFESALEFLDSERDAGEPACLILDVKMQGLSGLELQKKLVSQGYNIPIVFISGHSTVPLSVQAMKMGAIHFLCKPFDDSELLSALKEALKQAAENQERMHAKQQFNSLTTREHEVMQHLIAGARNKQIAFELDISERTIKAHRKQIMEKLDIESIAELVRLTEQAGISPVKTSY